MFTAILLSIHMRFPMNFYMRIHTRILMRFPMTRYCNIFGQFCLNKRYFFTLFQSNLFQSITTVIFSEQLFLQNSCFFWGAPFSRTVTFPQHCFFQNSYFFWAKLLPRNHTLIIGNYLVQLPFGTATHRIYLQKGYFFEP